MTEEVFLEREKMKTQLKLYLRIMSATSVFIYSVINYSTANAQSKKIDLEDVNIQGELHKQDQLQLLARERVQLKGMVELRTNYKEELSEELPEGFEKAFTPKKKSNKK